MRSSANTLIEMSLGGRTSGHQKESTHKRGDDCLITQRNERDGRDHETHRLRIVEAAESGLPPVNALDGQHNQSDRTACAAEQESPFGTRIANQAIGFFALRQQALTHSEDACENPELQRLSSHEHVRLATSRVCTSRVAPKTEIPGKAIT